MKKLIYIFFIFFVFQNYSYSHDTSKGPIPKKIFEELNGNSDSYIHAIGMLHIYYAENDTAQKIIINALNSNNEKLILTAFGAINHCFMANIKKDTEVFNSFKLNIKRLSEFKNIDIRRNVAEAIGYYKLYFYRDILYSMLKDKSPIIRAAAIKAFYCMKDKSVEPEIKILNEKEKNKYVRDIIKIYYLLFNNGNDS